MNIIRINFVPFLTAGSFVQRTVSLTSRVAVVANTRVNECYIFTDRVKNPMQQPHDPTRVEKYFFSRTSAQVVLSTLQVVNLCAYVLIPFYVTTTLKIFSRSFYLGKTKPEMNLPRAIFDEFALGKSDLPR